MASTTEEIVLRQDDSDKGKALAQTQILLPPMSVADALTLVDILEQFTAAIWDTHGEAMVNLLEVRRLEEMAQTEGEGTEPDDADLPF